MNGARAAKMAVVLERVPDRIGPSGYTQAELDAARLRARTGLKP